MSEKKLVYANIRVPIEIKGESYEIHSDYMKIEFEICQELPEKPSSDNQSMIQKIFSVHTSSDHSSSDDTSSVHYSNDNTVVDKEEILKIFASDFGEKKTKTRLNSSFKGKKNRTQQFTRRNYQ